MRAKTGILLLASICMLGVACVRGKTTALPQEPTRKPGVVDYSTEGKLWFVGVSARVSRMSGPSDFLPLNLVLVDKNAGTVTIGRESFVLETPDGVRLPVISYDYFKDDYRNDRSDRRIGEDYVERFTGRFPQPPFTWRELEFFPIRNSGIVPRDSIQTREGELLWGFVYFAKPSEDYVFPEGMYKLLFTPLPDGPTFVVELFPY
jgi:hypothetical protein